MLKLFKKKIKVDLTPSEYNKPRLIQRLKEPFFNEKNEPSINPFGFGGGLVNGGISDDAMKILSRVFEFDYMGSAEYEWGAVPESLDVILKRRKIYTTGSIKIKKKDVYYICEKGHVGSLKQTIKELSNKWDGKIKLKEPSLFNFTLGYKDEDDGTRPTRLTKGWLDLNNHLMFFLDEDMFNKTCHVFDIKRDED